MKMGQRHGLQWRKRLFFLCMSCGAVLTVEPEPK
ncbi:MAG: hypothetical protein QOJ58_5434 [Alphaproteobacteria bacterium]|jgi:hypothetical protein|nr:hypothetical protein [Alphaproteobacteria bacterium]